MPSTAASEPLFYRDYDSFKNNTNVRNLHLSLTMSNFILPNINKCKVFHNGRFEMLNEDIYRRLQEFCKEVYIAKNVRFVFRADGNVAHTYNSSYDSPELARRIFMIGVKGNSFFSNYDQHRVDMYCHGQEIFEHIQEAVNNNQGTENFRNNMQRFVVQNTDFAHFFKNNANKMMFANAFNTRSKLFINDYYETFLHSLYRIGYKNKNSQYISTSTSIDTARNFQNGGILLVCWLCKSGIIPYFNINKRNSKIASKGLPVYNQCVYFYQKEICLKYGILPHVILGYFYNEDFIVNHHLVEDIVNRSLDDIIHGGVIIDQKDFRQVLSETRYKRGYNLTTHQYIS